MPDKGRPSLGGTSFDATGRIGWADEAFCHLLAIELVEALGSSLGCLFPGEARCQPPFPNEGFQFETPYLRTDAEGWLETLWLRVVAKRVHPMEGAPFVALVEDVSAANAKAYALLEMERRYASIMDASESPVFFLLPNRTLADCNLAAATLAGRGKEELIGNPYWLRLWFQDDRDSAERLNAAIGQALDGRAGHVILATPGQAGGRGDFDYAVNPIQDGEDELAGLFIEAHDITDIRRRSSELYHTAVETLSGRLKLLERGMASAADHIVYLDRAGMVVEANESTMLALGHDRRTLCGMSLAAFADDFTGEDFTTLFDLAQRTGHARREMSLRRMDGTQIPVELLLSSFQNGETPLTCGIFRDIAERRRSDRQVRVLSNAVEQSPLVIVIADARGIVEFVNRAFSVVTGHENAEIVGQLADFLNPAVTPADTVSDIRTALASIGIWRGILVACAKNGTLFRQAAVIFSIQVEKNVPSQIIAIMEDVNLREDTDDALHQNDRLDRLTGLANRNLALANLNQALLIAERSGNIVAALMVDIDGLSRINDGLGHDAGDSVIAACGQRIAGLVHEPNIVARIEGGHFLIVLCSLESPTEAEALARNIAAACHQPYALGHQDVPLAVKIGVALFPLDAQRPHEMIRKAYIAARGARDRDGTAFRFYATHMDEQAQARFRMESLLQRALERGEIRVVYQPLVSMPSKRIVGAEALVRWSSPELGEVPPDRFIPLAEASGLIVELSDWILATASRDAGSWRCSAWGELTLAVNFSPRQFEDEKLLDGVLKILKASGFPPTSLEVEVTERLLITDSEKVLSILKAMKEAGIRLSIDDFGTGYSSLSYLRKYPFDHLKIDRSFVVDMPQSFEARCVVTAIVDMAHALGMEVVAEGVESAEHERLMTGVGCEILQGYRFGRPMPADAFARLIAGA